MAVQVASRRATGVAVPTRGAVRSSTRVQAEDRGSAPPAGKGRMQSNSVLHLCSKLPGLQAASATQLKPVAKQSFPAALSAVFYAAVDFTPNTQAVS